jgi:hypothetical protein
VASITGACSRTRVFPDFMVEDNHLSVIMVAVDCTPYSQALTSLAALSSTIS